MLMKKGVSNGLNSLSLWDRQGPTSQHLFLKILILVFDIVLITKWKVGM